MKTELLDKLARNRDELLALVDDLQPEEIAGTHVIGEWTIKDAVGHIAFWEGVILDHVHESYTEGRPRPMRDDENDDILNPQQVAKRKSRPWLRIRAEFVNVRAALIAQVASLTDTDLSFQVPSPWWHENRFYPVGQMIEEDAIGHCREHAEQIEQWRSREKN
jgi:hypothetical protein